MGVVVSFEPRSERMVLFSEGQHLVTRLPRFGARPRPGETVKLKGLTTASRLFSVKVISLESIAPPAGRPAPRKMTPLEALDATSQNAWSEVSGYVQMALTNYPSPDNFLNGRVSLQMREGEKILHVVAPGRLEAVRQEHGGRVALLLTVLVMPNGMSGIEVARHLQDDRPDLKVIFMTGHSQELVDHGSRLVAGVDFLPKPFENRGLVRIIRDRLDTHQVSARN